MGPASVTHFFTLVRDDLESMLDDAVDWFSYRTGRLVPESWAEVPFTTKEDIRSFKYSGDSGRILRWLSSSGTVWEPLLFPWSTEDQRHLEEGVLTAQQGRPDFTGRTAVVVSPTGVSGVGHFALHQMESLGAAVVHIGIAPPAAIAAVIEQSGASILFSLPLVASRLGTFQPLANENPVSTIILGGDAAAPSRINRISKTWGAETFDYLGMSELYGPIASQVQPGILSWTAPDVLVEVLDPDTREPVAPGQIGVLVVTTLWRKAMPLLRYWTDDHVRMIAAPEGELRFATMGRPINHVRIGNGERMYLRDVDDLVLAHEGSGSDWRLVRDGHEFVLQVETMPGGSFDAHELGDEVTAMGSWTVRAEAVEFGYLPRDEPKLVWRK